MLLESISVLLPKFEDLYAFFIISTETSRNSWDIHHVLKDQIGIWFCTVCYSIFVRSLNWLGQWPRIFQCKCKYLYDEILSIS